MPQGDPSSNTYLSEALSALPLFPLSNVVFFPGTLLPLHVFEPRYRAMVRDCLQTHRSMAVVRVLQGPLDTHGLPPLEPIAGIGVIVEWVELADGRFNILLRGEARARLTELPFSPPYRRAQAELVPDLDEEPSEQDRLSLLSLAQAFAAQARALHPNFDFSLPAHPSMALATQLIAAHLVLDIPTRQELLETLSPRERTRRLLDVLAAQHVTLRSSHPRTIH